MTQPVFLWKESIFHPSPFRSSICVRPLLCYALLCYIPHVLQHFTPLAFTYFACLEPVMVTTFRKGIALCHDGFAVIFCIYILFCKKVLTFGVVCRVVVNQQLWGFGCEKS